MDSHARLCFHAVPRIIEASFGPAANLHEASCAACERWGTGREGCVRRKRHARAIRDADSTSPSTAVSAAAATAAVVAAAAAAAVGGVVKPIILGPEGAPVKMPPRPLGIDGAAVTRAVREVIDEYRAGERAALAALAAAAAATSAAASPSPCPASLLPTAEKGEEDSLYAALSGPLGRHGVGIEDALALLVPWLANTRVNANVRQVDGAGTCAPSERRRHVPAEAANMGYHAAGAEARAWIAERAVVASQCAVRRAQVTTSSLLAPATLKATSTATARVHPSDAAHIMPSPLAVAARLEAGGSATA